MKFNKTVILLALLFIMSHVALGAGKCIPIAQTAAKDASLLSGFLAPICVQPLNEAGITHIWMDETDVIDGDINGECVNSSIYWYDRYAYKYAHVFIDDPINNIVQPSRLCQQGTLSSICLNSFRPCNPDLDITNYVSKPKICRWFCSVMAAVGDGHDDICTADDRNYLNSFGLNAALTAGSCFDNELYGDNEDCLAPLFLSSNTAPTCQLYTGTKCKALYRDDAPIYVPAGTTQEYLESLLDFENTFLSLPKDNTDCATAWTKLFCQTVFPSCLSTGMRQSTITNGIIDTENYKLVYHATEVQTPQSTCDLFQSVCPLTPLFQHPFVKQSFADLDCAEAADIRKNSCFPRGLTHENAKDYVNAVNSQHQSSEIPQKAQQSELFGNIEQINEALGGLNLQAPTKVIYSSNLTQKAQTIADGNPNHQRFTMEQIDRINQLNNIYNFNSKSFLDTYEVSETVYLGPEPWEPGYKQSVLYGYITAANSDQYIDPQSLITPTTCPTPLVVPNSLSELTLFNGICAQPCPSSRFSSNDHRLIEISSLILVCLALLFSGILSVSFLIFKSQKAKKNLFYYTLSYFGVALMLFIGLMNRNGDRSTYYNQCETPTHASHMTGFALFQALFLIYFLLSSSCWWMIQAVDLFERLILARIYRGIERRRRQLAFHIFSWGAPVLCCCGMLLGGQLGYDGFLPFAFVSQDDQLVSNSIPLSWFFVFGPILLMALIGLGLVGIIMFFLMRYDPTGGLKKFSEEIHQSVSIWYKLKSSLKLFGFVFLMLFMIILLCVHQLYAGANEIRWDEEERDWGQLLLIGGSDLAGPLTSGMSPSRVVVTVAAFSSPGIVMFILYFIFSQDLFGLWCGLFYNAGFSFLKSFVKEDTITGSDRSSGTGSSGGSKGSAGSTDLFTAEIGLTKKNKTNQSTSLDIDSSGLPDSIIASNGGNSHTSATGGLEFSQPSSGSSQPQKTQSSAQIRRTTLFKGFSKPKPPSKRPPGSREGTQPVVIHNEPNSIELEELIVEEMDENEAMAMGIDMKGDVGKEAIRKE